MLPFEITAECDKLLAEQKGKYARRGVLGDLLNTTKPSITVLMNWRVLKTLLPPSRSSWAVWLPAWPKYDDKLGLPDFEFDPMVSGEIFDEKREQKMERDPVERVAKVSRPALKMFISLCLNKYAKAHVEPGHAVGTVGTQSIGEPGTQMTLKTFHFAGVAGMSITQGVPRIKEIFNVPRKVISTPVITCPLENKKKIEAARVVKGRIENTYIFDVIHFIKDLWSERNSSICLSVDTNTLNDMHLGITVENIATTICKNRKLKIRANDVTVTDDCIFIRVTNDSGEYSSGRGASVKNKPTLDEGGSDIVLRVNHLKLALPTLAISGYPNATRAIIQTSEQSEHTVLVEGYGLRACMTTEGVIGTQCTSNRVMETREVLGIGAARITIANEIGAVMGDIGIDPLHMQLLADVITYKGEVLGITRFGLSKMRDSVLRLTSFEKTPDHLFEAAAGMKSNMIESVSECIIVGQTMSVGTGAFKVVRRLGLKPEHTQKKASAFEDAWKWDQVERKKSSTAMEC